MSNFAASFALRVAWPPWLRGVVAVVSQALLALLPVQRADELSAFERHMGGGIFSRISPRTFSKRCFC
jgi:hypothetical protein